MDLSQKNFRQLIIGKDVNRTASVTPATLAIGEIALFTPNNVLITAANASSHPKARVVKKGDDGLLQFSDVIVKNQIKSIRSANGSNPIPQITYLGYNGTTGALDTTNDNTFLLRFSFKSLITSSNRNDVFHHAEFTSPKTGTTQVMVATNLQQSVSDNFHGSHEKLLRAELVNSGTNTSIGTGAGSATFVKNSKVVSVTDVDNATTNTALLVGELIGVGGVFGVIEAIDTVANTVTLSVPWQGESQVVANASVRRIKVAALGDFGLKFTTITQNTSLGRIISSTFNFDLISQGFDIAKISEVQGGRPGTNTGSQVAEREYFYQGNQGDQIRWDQLTYSGKTEAENILYDAISIGWTDSIENGGVLNVPHKELEILIPATRSNNQYSLASTGIKASFDAFFSTTLTL